PVNVWVVVQHDLPHLIERNLFVADLTLVHRPQERSRRGKPSAKQALGAATEFSRQLGVQAQHAFGDLRAGERLQGGDCSEPDIGWLALIEQTQKRRNAIRLMELP